jgi:hypothetical protein
MNMKGTPHIPVMRKETIAMDGKDYNGAGREEALNNNLK